ncbi:MAG: hypothetical protein GF401_02340 [Chitinivibrionales bacterium]|nr:hypothetical protein [Chitinivibrionales bacterium]
MHTSLEIYGILAAGVIVITGFFAGKGIQRLKLPSIIGFMLVGVILGPSFLNLADESLQRSFSFITEIALAFVAVSIGLELSVGALKKQGIGIVAIILAESFGAFVLVTAVLYGITRDWAVALLFGAIAPASAPAGTVAVIKECRARGSLTKALYAVVGFDDGLGIVIFGFAAAVARMILEHANGTANGISPSAFAQPLIEIILSIVIGAIMALVFCILARRLRSNNDIFILGVGFVFALTGICSHFHCSLILSNMVFGMMITNTQPHTFTTRFGNEISRFMPLLFVLFFALAGAHLHLHALGRLGLLGLVYMVARSAGLILGSRLGATVGKVDEKIKKYIGLGILSQAGVAIGLSLIVKNEFAGLGPVVATAGDQIITRGDQIGTTVITTITATCIVFELIGPILTRHALSKAKEIQIDSTTSR